MRRHLLPIAAIALVFLVQVVPASAHLERHPDPDDRAGADLRWVELRRTHQGRRLEVDLGTGQERPSWARFRIFFDTRGDSRADYFLQGEYDGASSGLGAWEFFRMDGAVTEADVDVVEPGFPSWFPIEMNWWRLHATRHIRWRITMRNLNKPPHGGWTAPHKTGGTRTSGAALDCAD